MANELQIITDDLDKALVSVQSALPKNFNRDRFLQNTIAVLKQNPDLTKYNKNELLSCILKGSYLGLNFYAGECYLVPYANHITFQTGYKGDCKFVKKYSIRPLADIYAKVVRKGDEIKYGVNADGQPYLEWNPLPFNGGDIVGVFAVAYFKDGGMLYEVMNLDEIQKVRRVSRAGQSGPWKDWFESMACKSCLRKLCKSIETDFDNVEQRDAWNDGSGVDFSIKPESAEVHNPFKKTEVVNDKNDETDVIDSVAVEISEAEQLEMPFTEPKKGV